MIEFIIGAVCGVFGFMLLMEWLASKHDEFVRRGSDFQYSNREDIGNLVGKVIRENTIMMRVEFDKATKLYFCYDSTTNDYVCQGHNLKEIQKAFKLRYPSKLGHILLKYNHFFSKEEWSNQDEWHHHIADDCKGIKYLDALEDALKESKIQNKEKEK